jgi:SAM-dependent methyltransferase
MSMPDIFCDPVTLERLDDASVASKAKSGGYYDFSVGRPTAKNDAEERHFRANYRPANMQSKSYANRIRGVSHPRIEDATVVVDLGCGPYPNIAALAGQHVLIDDLMPFYCTELGFNQVPGAKIASRAEVLPLCSASVDVVYSVNMIDHVDDMLDVCLEIARVLKPDGTLFLQSYFNSFPLLPSEPGVFDGHFLEEFFLKIFEPVEMASFALGDPRISRSYNCDIIVGTFRPRASWQQVLEHAGPRSAYADPEHMGVQSRISEAILALDRGELDVAGRWIESVERAGRPSYELHIDLLKMRHSTASGDFGRANLIGKSIRTNPRVLRNVRYLLTLERLENRRVIAATAAR